jgi:hypothetical protein
MCIDRTLVVMPHGYELRFLENP